MKPSPRRDALTFEWSRRDERIVIGRIVCPADVKVTIVHYLPWDLKGGYTVLPGGEVQGRTGPAGQPVYLVWTSRPGEPAVAPPGGVALTYVPDADRIIAFAAGVGENPAELAARLTRYRNAENIGDLIDEEAGVYEEKRVKVRGLYAGVAEAITNGLHWSVLYQPGFHRLYLPDGRAAILPRPDGRPDHWTVRGTNAFLDALAVSLESQKLAVDALTAVLETQYPDGNMPGWRNRSSGSADRSQPPVGAYVTLKLFERLGDLDILRRAYPYLQRWHEFWTAPRPGGTARRDGNGDGLLEWGSDASLVGKNVPSWEKNASGRMRAGWESGQDDLPNWDDAPFNEETGTLAMNCLDLNSLYALDAWSLAEMAAVLGRAADAERYRDQYERMRTLINARLWNEREGFYYDRFWDGRFSVHKAASAFYTLLARIPDEARAQRMLKRLARSAPVLGRLCHPVGLPGRPRLPSREPAVVARRHPAVGELPRLSGPEGLPFGRRRLGVRPEERRDVHEELEELRPLARGLRFPHRGGGGPAVRGRRPAGRADRRRGMPRLHAPRRVPLRHPEARAQGPALARPHPGPPL